MLRAKFETLEKQREFFIKVKKKLGIGARELSKRLNLKSRGAIESYTFMRTAPPVEIVQRLEKISGIKTDYENIEGKVYRKTRGFMPLNPLESKKILTKKFGKDMGYLTDLIQSRLTLKEIINKIRIKGYKFDNSHIARCIGAYRTNLLSKIVPDLKNTKNEIILKGHIRKDKKTLSINFNLSSLSKRIKEKDIRIGLEISEDRKKIRIFPLNFGRKMIEANGAIKILLTEKSRLKIKSHVDIIINPTLFGLEITDSIYDLDAKRLFREAIKEGFDIDPQRSTPNNHKGDLSLFLRDKNILIELTKANSYKSSYFKIGQCYLQKISWPKSIQFLVCKESLLSKDALKGLKKLKIRVFYTNFNKGWERNIILRIKDELKK